MPDQRPIVGHIRFSFYGMTDTRLRPDPDNAALAELYAETRMARRFYLFERLTLPSLLAQTDPDFRIVIMSSDVMPDIYKARLRKVTAHLADVQIVFSRMRRGLFAYQAPMKAVLGPDQTGTAVHFRLDDDDALARTYIERLRRQSAGLPPATHITYPKGVMLFPARPGASEGSSILTTELLTAQGLAYVADAAFNRNPFAMMHRKVWLDCPLLSDPGFPAYIRTQHFDNDTVARQDLVLDAIRRNRSGERAAQHAAAVDDALAQEFPFLSRRALDATLGELVAIRSMADLGPPA